MRWQTADPLGFEDGLNLYAYVHHHPFYYKDPDGQFALPFPVVIPIFEAVFGAVATVTFLPAIGTALGVAAIGYGCYQLAVYASNQIDVDDQFETGIKEQRESRPVEGKKKPRYCGKELGDDPTKCPGEGFEWKGKGGPETGRGNWIKGTRADGTLEELHPDLHHLPPKDPHWDYFGPDCPKGAELYLDGAWEFK